MLKSDTEKAIVISLSLKYGRINPIPRNRPGHWNVGHSARTIQNELEFSWGQRMEVSFNFEARTNPVPEMQQIEMEPIHWSCNHFKKIGYLLSDGRKNN